MVGEAGEAVEAVEAEEEELLRPAQVLGVCSGPVRMRWVSFGGRRNRGEWCIAPATNCHNAQYNVSRNGLLYIKKRNGIFAANKMVHF